MRASIRLGLVAFAGVLVGDACTRRVFECIAADNCISRGVQGVCEDPGFCSYPDAECPSHQRYDEFAGDGLAYECVPEDDATGSGGATPSSSGATRTDDGTSDTGGCIPECIDRDGDGYGVGPSCAGEDCDDDNPAHSDACVYVSPDGSDETGNGTRELPYLSFTHALPLLGPGTSLVLLDGAYEIGTTGMLQVDCAAEGGPPSGTDGAPIGVRAENERMAALVSDGSTPALTLDNCGWWTLHGLRVRSGDLRESEGGSGSTVARINDSHDIVVRRLLASHNNRYFNNDLLSFSASSRVLVEEAEFYDFQAGAVDSSGSDNLVFRRCYANNRGYPDLDTCDPNDGCDDHEIGCCSKDYYDTAFALLYGTSDSAIENCIVDGPIGMGFSLVEGATNDAIRGSIVLDGSSYGAFVAAAQTGSVTVGNTIEDLLVIGSDLGVYLRSTTDTSVRGATLLRSGTAFSADQNSAPLCLELSGGCSFTAERVLAQGSEGSGFGVSAEQAPWTIVSCNSFGNGADYPIAEEIGDDEDYIQYSMSVDANIGTAVDQCAVYVPEGTPMSGAAADGSDIGATILWRIEGAVTDVPLWDPETGSFPCGAIIPGINDEPTLSCTGVNTRLNVFTNGCPVPPEYPAPTECG